MLCFLLAFPSISNAQLTPRAFIVPLPGVPIAWESLPSSPRPGDGYAVHDANDDCDGGDGTRRVFVVWSGEEWQCFGGSGGGGSAADIAYSPNNPEDWSEPPETLAEAADLLASIARRRIVIEGPWSETACPYAGALILSLNHYGAGLHEYGECPNGEDSEPEPSHINSHAFTSYQGSAGDLLPAQPGGSPIVQDAAAGLSNTCDADTYTCLMEIAAGGVTTQKLSGAAKAQSKNFTITDPTTGLTNKLQIQFAQAVTLTTVACSTDTGTVTIQLDKRAQATPNTSGTNALSGSLVCDNDRQSTTSFSSAGVATNQVLNVQITATASSPTVVRIHVFAAPDNES